MATRKLSKVRVRYRKASGSRRCGNCVMFRPASSSCTLVAGVIRAGDVCDRWAAK